MVLLMVLQNELLMNLRNNVKNFRVYTLVDGYSESHLSQRYFTHLLKKRNSFK